MAIDKICSTDCLVMAEDFQKAKFAVALAIRNSEIEFEESDFSIEIDSCMNFDTSESALRKEIKSYGILVDGEIRYDNDIIEQIVKQQRESDREEWLKKYHLELPLETP